MKSTKYQLLKDGYDFVCRELGEYRKIIEQLRQENNDYIDTLTRIRNGNIDGIIYQCWAEIVLHKHEQLKS